MLNLKNKKSKNYKFKLYGVNRGMYLGWVKLLLRIEQTFITKLWGGGGGGCNWGCLVPITYLLKHKSWMIQKKIEEEKTEKIFLNEEAMI